MATHYKLSPQDEFVHAPGPEINFNESVYVNAFSDATGVGGWMRLGNRVNEGYAELSVVLYLPGGRLAVKFGKPPITHNNDFAAGGLRFDVLKPMQLLTATYDGEVAIVENPDDLREPARLFAEAKRETAIVRWNLETISPQQGGEPLTPDRPTMYGRDFSLGHFNQHVRVTGDITVGEDTWLMAPGRGWRDHSWGPRWWTNIVWYRLLLCAFPDGRGFMIHKIADTTNRARRSGVLLIDGAYHEIADFDLITEWTTTRDPARIRVNVVTENCKRASILGEVLALAPLRNRRQEAGTTLHSRIAEAHMRWTWDGVTGYGMAEYIERIASDGSFAGYPL
jgi:hypothetical protein